MTRSPSTDCWQTRNISTFSNFRKTIRLLLLTELRVNWCSPRLQPLLWSACMWAQCLSSVYYPQWVWGYFTGGCRREGGEGGEADGESQLCVNVIWKHTAHPSLMHFHQLTFAGILWLPIYSVLVMRQVTAVNIGGNRARGGRPDWF